MKIRQGKLPEGKGMFLWYLFRLADGDMAKLAKALFLENYQWVCVKVVEGRYLFNEYEKERVPYQIDLLDQLAPELKAYGIELHLWGYHYGVTRVGWDQTAKEIPHILNMIGRYQALSYTFNCEKEMRDRPGRRTAAERLCVGVKEGMARTNDSIPDIPLLLSSYKWPYYHPKLPWDIFAKYMDAWAPQVYWEKAHNPASQLLRSINEYQKLADLPIIPAGSAYPNSSIGWEPAPADFQEFNQAAKDRGLKAVYYWEYEYLERNPRWRQEIASHEWDIGDQEPEPDSPPAPEPSPNIDPEEEKEIRNQAYHHAAETVRKLIQ